MLIASVFYNADILYCSLLLVCIHQDRNPYKILCNLKLGIVYKIQLKLWVVDYWL